MGEPPVIRTLESIPGGMNIWQRLQNMILIEYGMRMRWRVLTLRAIAAYRRASFISVPAVCMARYMACFMRAAAASRLRRFMSGTDIAYLTVFAVWYGQVRSPGFEPG